MMSIMIYYAMYLIYLTINASLLKLGINWGFNHDIGWGSALTLSTLASSFILFHRIRVKPE